jgi:hypothetical protein
MHVVVDLGEMHSCLACWEKGSSLDEACISVRIPGIAAFQSGSGAACWERRHLREYLSFINREYLIPSRLIIESAALAVPDILNLSTRRILLDILEETFGLYEAIIIPHPLALTAGILGSRADSAPAGDILLIEPQKSGFSCAFVSIIDETGITLEKQFTGSTSDILPAAELLGYYSAQGWTLNHIILAGIDAWDPVIAFISALVPAVNIVCIDDPGSTAAEGLSALRNGINASPIHTFNVVYPYNFYISGTGSDHLERIPFNMINLELNCSGRYILTRLQTAATDIIADENRASFCIYEINPDDFDHLEKSQELPLPVLTIDSPLSDLPPDFDLSLNLASATLQLDTASAMAEESSCPPEVLALKLASTQQKLWQWLSRNEQNEFLLMKWNDIPQPHDPNLSLSASIDQTLFHLHGLLQLWHNR